MTKKFSRNISNMFRKSTQITDPENVSISLLEIKEDTMKEQLLNSEKCNESIVTCETSIDNNIPKTSSADIEEKSTKVEVNSKKDDSKLHFYNHHTAQEYSPSQLGEDMLMAALEFGSS